MAYVCFPSQRIGRSEAQFVVVQKDLGKVCKVATQEGEDALQFSGLIEDQEVKRDLEFRTPCFIILKLGIFDHLRNCKR